MAAQIEMDLQPQFEKFRNGICSEDQEGHSESYTLSGGDGSCAGGDSCSECDDSVGDVANGGELDSDGEDEDSGGVVADGGDLLLSAIGTLVSEEDESTSSSDSDTDSAPVRSMDLAETLGMRRGPATMEWRSSGRPRYRADSLVLMVKKF
ncbi:unnamed protein product [Arabis nemorensis]|uniref:Uncharacterized protein n=1 Tax=Arabis nemorensis TaxID=586526 RepID=A0A565BFV4_9BRAS|nr:unnamed protein product [Arabis nemorensis]